MRRPETATITRAQLQEGVEHAIGRISDPNVPEHVPALLRHVAATADRVARGSFNRNGCGCPLYQAGLATGWELARADYVVEFAMSFDGRLGPVTNFAPVLVVEG